MIVFEMSPQRGGGVPFSSYEFWYLLSRPSETVAIEGGEGGGTNVNIPQFQF